ncbi:hypothetical protein OIU78_027041 [Salix suchowensis]|nr:hypothetical protein OIU78_027041 [Salix suchowensis]
MRASTVIIPSCGCSTISRSSSLTRRLSSSPPNPLQTVNFFHGAQVLGTASFCSPATTTIDLICSIQEKNKMILSGILEKAVNICANRGVKTETVLEAGEPYELICNAVQKNNIDVLVIGNTSINGALKRDFLGRLSKYCLNNARCHVLVVKNQDE